MSGIEDPHFPKRGFRELVRERRATVSKYPDSYPKNLSGPRHFPRTERAVNDFLARFREKINPRVQRLSSLSELPERELLDMFSKILTRYIVYLKRVRKETAIGLMSGDTFLAQRIVHDVPTLLLDFSIAVKSVKRYSPKITERDKHLIYKLMFKRTPRLLDRLSRDLELAQVYSPGEIKSALTARKDGEAFLREFLPVMQKGRTMLTIAGLTADAAWAKLRAFLAKAIFHGNTQSRSNLNKMLDNVVATINATPYAKFELAFITETQNPRHTPSIKQSIGKQLGLSNLVLDIYLAQFFRTSIFTAEKLSAHHRSLTKNTGNRFSDDAPISLGDSRTRGELTGEVDKGFERTDWAMILEKKFPGAQNREVEKVVEKIGAWSFQRRKSCEPWK